MAKRGRPPKNPLAKTLEISSPEMSAENSAENTAIQNAGNDVATTLETGNRMDKIDPTTGMSYQNINKAKKRLSAAQKEAIQKMLKARAKVRNQEAKAERAKEKAKKEKIQSATKKVKTAMGRKFL